ncbi:hypothetical protein BJF93_18965 [Xaviernesmea oryzae]|uniref:EamA domain-containing protein n=1 Tax=Xaviernesmea oryzae TaxID=464029 RepID=A0A1Q9B191_9HYPH|nr:DMT family transporter [Xaviernesmea oryzae]OLP61781.1 hypothetical protein BJF93_18965 [Xaviernesmea oryzae]SEL77540.1 Permease of the drug/metabolite transporter (DMT) superfamily [Xaviernesmea oryzae]
MIGNIAPNRDLALLVALATLWGASYSFIKLGVETIPPITLIALRTLIAGTLLLALLRLRGIALPRDRRLWSRFVIQACLNSVLPFTLIAWAEQRIDAGLAVILNATTPIFAFLLTWLMTRHEPANGRKLFGVIAGLGGTCLVVGTEAIGGLGADILPQLAVLAAALCYAGAAIFGKRFGGLDPMLPATGSLLSGAMILLPVSLLVDRPWTMAPSAASLLALGGLSIFSTALAFVLYFRLVQGLGSLATTAQSYLRVPIGIAIGMVALGERPSATAGLGLAAILIGVAAMMPARRRAGEA